MQLNTCGEDLRKASGGQNGTRGIATMTQVDAVYQDGVFKPLQTVELPENRRVRLSIQPVEADNVRAWLDEVRQFQQRLIVERGCFPDSALDIAEDRRR
jgi:predicted DNA-binding antitoxin AbrB/MazE fold protein